MRAINFGFGLMLMILTVVNCFGVANDSVVILKDNVDVMKSYNDKTVIGKLSFLNEVKLISEEIKEGYVNVKLSDGKTGWIEEKNTSFCPTKWKKMKIDKYSFFYVPDNMTFSIDEGTPKHLDKILGYYKKMVNEEFVINAGYNVSPIEKRISKQPMLDSSFPVYGISPMEEKLLAEHGNKYKPIVLKDRTYYFIVSGVNMDGGFDYTLLTESKDKHTYRVGVTLIGNRSEEYHLMAMKIMFSLVLDK